MIPVMPLVVDCYNVLHTDMPAALAGLDESRLCRLLARTAWAGDGIVVVCDGSVKPHGPSHSPVPTVDLRYSGRGQSADDVITQMIRTSSAPRRLTVVSSDRQIQKAARRRRCRVIGRVEFVRLLAAAGGVFGEPTHRGKLDGPLTQLEVQQWLKRFGMDSDDQAGVDDLGRDN